MHIVFHGLIDGALAKPLKLENGLSAKKIMSHAVQISQGIYKCKNKYPKNSSLWEQLFKRTTTLKMSMAEGQRMDGIKTELTILDFLQLLFIINV